MDYQNNKKSIFKWVIIYALIGAVAYGLIYYFFFYKNDSQDLGSQIENEILINDSLVAKTFTSDNYYFSVLWPPQWKIEKTETGINLSGKEGSFTIGPVGVGTCLQDNVKEFTKGKASYWVCDLKEDGSYSYSDIIKVSNNEIAIGVTPFPSYTTDDGKWIFLKVLENIRLDPQEIASWKTYNNDQYGFTFKYPENFFAEEPLMVASQCASENFPTECPNAKSGKIIIDRVQYCYNQHDETVAGKVYYYDSYMTVRNYDAHSDNDSNFCLSVLLKTPEVDKRVENLDKIVPTFKFTK